MNRFKDITIIAVILIFSFGLNYFAVVSYNRFNKSHVEFTDSIFYRNDSILRSQRNELMRLQKMYDSLQLIDYKIKNDYLNR